jgi:hypothetical protein
MVVISPSATRQQAKDAKEALPPRAVVADKRSAGEKSEYILRRARAVPQQVRGRRLSFTFLPLLFMMFRSLDSLSRCQGDCSCLFHSLQHGLNRLELYSGDARSLRRDTSDFLRTHPCLEMSEQPIGTCIGRLLLLLRLFQPGDDFCGARNLD